MRSFPCKAALRSHRHGLPRRSEHPAVAPNGGGLESKGRGTRALRELLCWLKSEIRTGRKKIHNCRMRHGKRCQSMAAMSTHSVLLIMKKKAPNHRPKLLVPHRVIGQLCQWKQQLEITVLWSVVKSFNMGIYPRSSLFSLPYNLVL